MILSVLVRLLILAGLGWWPGKRQPRSIQICISHQTC